MIQSKVNSISEKGQPLVNIRVMRYRIKVMVPFSVTSLLSLV